MKKNNMNIFIVFIFLIVIVVALYKAFGDKMTHKYEIYHHSNLESQEDLEKKFLKNNLNVKDVTNQASDANFLGQEPDVNEVAGNIEIEAVTKVLSEEDAFVRCHVPTLNTQQCWQSRYFECPVTNGSYKQCTNNYVRLPKGGNAPCETGRAGFEMAPPKLKLSENCYYQSTKLISQQNKDMNQNVVY
jgi:hypothetical protein